MSGMYNLSRMHVQEMDMETVRVPDDDVARLMYYLSCVDTVIDYQEIDILTDYENYDLLTVDEMTKLFELVLIFNPKYFIEKGVFIVNEDLLPGNLSNQFYKITDERIGLHVSDQMFIGGRTVNVLKVMACSKDWLLRNYFIPWKNIFEMADRMHRYKTVQVPQPPPPKVIYIPKNVYIPVQASPPYVPPPPKKKDDCGCSCILF